MRMIVASLHAFGAGYAVSTQYLAGLFAAGLARFF